MTRAPMTSRRRKALVRGILFGGGAVLGQLIGGYLFTANGVDMAYATVSFAVWFLFGVISVLLGKRGVGIRKEQKTGNEN